MVGYGKHVSKDGQHEHPIFYGFLRLKAYMK